MIFFVYSRFHASPSLIFSLSSFSLVYLSKQVLSTSVVRVISLKKSLKWLIHSFAILSPGRCLSLSPSQDFISFQNSFRLLIHIVKHSAFTFHSLLFSSVTGFRYWCLASEVWHLYLRKQDGDLLYLCALVIKPLCLPSAAVYENLFSQQFTNWPVASFTFCSVSEDECASFSRVECY